MLEAPAAVPPPHRAPTRPALVAECYGDCLADLGVDAEPVVGPGPDGRLDVTVEDGEGQTLTWDVGDSNTGDVLTVPADEQTIAALESVGC